jgi:hypothetical protein
VHGQASPGALQPPLRQLALPQLRICVTCFRLCTVRRWCIFEEGRVDFLTERFRIPVPTTLVVDLGNEQAEAPQLHELDSSLLDHGSQLVYKAFA